MAKDCSLWLSVKPYLLIGALGFVGSCGFEEKVYAFTPSVINRNHESLPDDSSLQRLQELRDRYEKAAESLLDADEAIRLAIKNNPSLKIAETQIESQYWDLVSSQRQWLPTISFVNGNPVLGRFDSNTWIRNREPAIGSNVPSDYTVRSGYQLFAPSVVLNWTFFSLPRDAEINSDMAALESERLLYAVAMRNLILSVQQAYYQVQATQQLISSFTEIYEINKRQLEVLEARYSKQLIDVGSLEQTRTQYYTQLGQLLTTYEQYFTASAQLSNVIGVDDMRDFVPTGELDSTAGWDLTLKSSLSRAIEMREEIQASQAQARSFSWTARALYGSYYPTFSLALLGGMSTISGLQDYPSFAPSRTPFRFNQTELSSTVGVGFNWTIFDGGVNAAAASSFKAQARQQEFIAIQEQEVIEREVKTAFFLFKTSDESISVAKRALESARKAQEAAKVRFDIGVGDITTVVQTVALYGQAYTSYTQALLNYNLAVSQLYRYTASYPSDALDTKELTESHDDSY